MTTAELAGLISTVGVPFAYYQFPEGTNQPTPFICYYFPENDDVFADNTNYVRIYELHIELYTDEKDFELEERLENILLDAGLSFVKSEAWIKSEKMQEVLYQTEVIING
jgi:hypothetical protein